MKTLIDVRVLSLSGRSKVASIIHTELLSAANEIEDWQHGKDGPKGTGGITIKSYLSDAAMGALLKRRDGLVVALHRVQETCQ